MAIRVLLTSSRAQRSRSPLLVSSARCFATKGDAVNLLQALISVKESAKANFDETVEIALNLGVDPRKQNQNIRSSALLPHGTGKAVRVAVFGSSEDDAEALAAGADLVGFDDIIADVTPGTTFPVAKGIINFDRCVATPSMMPKLGRVARILGPRGLMPNPKMGTVTTDFEKIVKELKGGQVQFRTDKKGIIHAGVGKVSFPVENLKENIRALMVVLSKLKPETSKGTYIQGAHVCSTMGKSFKVEVSNIDPSSPRFMI